MYMKSQFYIFNVACEDVVRHALIEDRYLSPVTKT